MVERQALGRGLSALIREPERKAGEARFLPVADIIPNASQPRKQFDEARIAELAESIQERGLLQPILVRRRDSGYEIVVGERRWRAAQAAGLASILAIVRETSDRESIELALVENIQREDLNPIELATAYRGLLDLGGLTQEELAGRLGKDRATVANLLRLLALPRDIQQNVIEGTLTMGHARALLSAGNAARQRAIRDRIVAEGLSVREVERLAQGGRPSPPGGRAAVRKSEPTFARLQGELQNHFQTPVLLRRRGRRGTIEITFYGDDDLDRIVRRMLD